MQYKLNPQTGKYEIVGSDPAFQLKVDPSVAQMPTALEKSAPTMENYSPDEKANAGMAQMGAQTTAGSKSGAGKLGGGLMAGSAFGGPAAPYLFAAGLGLSAIGGAQDQKRQEAAEKQQRILNALGQFRGAVV